MVATRDLDSRELKLWDLESGESKTIQLWGGAHIPSIVSVSHDGQSLAVQMTDGEVGFTTFENEDWLRTSISFGSIALSPEGHHVFIGEGHSRPPVVSEDGKFVVTGLDPLAVWTPSSPTAEKRINPTEIWELGKERSGSLALWDIAKRKLRGHILLIRSPNLVSLKRNRLAAYDAGENVVHFADIERNVSWEIGLKGQATRRGSSARAFAPDLKRLASASGQNYQEQAVAIRDLRSGDLVATLAANGPMQEISFGKRLVAAITEHAWGRRIQAWEAASEEDLLADLRGAVDLRQFGLDELRLVTEKQLWQLQDFASLRTLDFSNVPVTDELLSALRGLESLEVLYLSRTQITDGGLEHLDELPNLNTLNLSHTNVTDDGLEHLETLRNLKSLDLSDTRVTDDGLEHLKTLKNLNSLRLSDHVSGAARLELYWHLPEFREQWSRVKNVNLPESWLSQSASSRREDESIQEDMARENFLIGASASRDAADNVVELGREFTDADLQRLRDFPLLRSLYIYPRSHVTDGGLAPLSELSHLESLGIYGSLITGPGLRHLADLPELAELSLQGHSITDSTLADVARLRHLRKLELEGTNIKGDGLKHLRELDKLTELHISRHSSRRWLNSDEQLPIDYLLSLPQLERLGVVEAKLAPDSLGELLRKLPNLTSLTIELITESVVELKQARGIREVRLVIDRASDSAAFAHLADLAQLERLYFGLRFHSFAGNETVGSAEFEHIAKLKQLKSLGLERTKIGDDDLGALQEFAQLEELDLADTGVGDVGIAHLAKLRRLSEIDLSNTRITDSGVAALAELAELRRLDLCNSQITDGGMKHLARLSKLERLDLSATKVTDEGLQYLERLENLQQLSLPFLSRTVTTERIRALRQALPDCVITPWVPRDDDNDDPG